MKRLAILLILFCFGCDDHGGDNSSNTSSSASLRTAATETELETYLKKGLTQQSKNARTYRYFEMDGTTTVVGAPFSSVSAGDRSYSGTNLQVVGVDEADRIKTDGQVLYLAEQNDASVSTGRGDRGIRVLTLDPGSANAVGIARITLADALPLAGLYLFKDPEKSGEELLVALGTTDDRYYAYALDWFMPWSWQERQTEVNLVDVSAPNAPQMVRNYTFDGQLVSSRRIGNRLYLVLRYHPSLPDFKLYPLTDRDVLENQVLIEKATLDDLMPRYRIDGEDRGSITPYNRSYLPNVSSGSATADIITLVALDLGAPTASPYAITIAGPTETLYMSTRALYLATTSYHYQPVTRTDALVTYDSSMTTDLHKIALAETGPEYRGSGSVDGHLGWEQDKKSFRMGEVGDAIGIVTSLDESWSGDATSKLTILKESTTAFGTLAEVAHLPNASRKEPLGKPGERLYSARFMGNRLYLVTFRVTDPLYILNLANPQDPFIEGSLKIEGYSDYLHPVGENLLLGIGKDAVPDLSAPAAERGAWYQGLKLSLFDVSDAASPTEIKSIVIGKRGTGSEVLVDHHAIAYLESGQGSARFAIPVELHATAASPADTTEPWYYYDWTHTGLYLFDITGISSTTPDIDVTGKMVVNSNTTGEYDGYGEGDRAVILSDSVYYVHKDSVWSSPWAHVDEFFGPQ